MKQENDAVNFTTLHEIRFIESMGLSRPRNSNLFSRITLLEKYIKAAEKRTDWGVIDKDAVISTAQRLLKEVSK